MCATFCGDRGVGLMNLVLSLYFHGEHSVGTAMSRHLLVRGTNNGQRKFTEQTDNCTVLGPVQALAGETTFQRRNAGTERKRGTMLAPQIGLFLGVFCKARCVGL